MVAEGGFEPTLFSVHETDETTTSLLCNKSQGSDLNREHTDPNINNRGQNLLQDSLFYSVALPVELPWHITSLWPVE